MHTHTQVFKVIHGVTIPLNIASNMFCEKLADARAPHVTEDAIS